MTGPAASKVPIKVNAYIHKKDEATGSKIIHVDIESPLLGEIVLPKEATYCAGKPGGVFIGLKKKMLERAKKVIARLEKR